MKQTLNTETKPESCLASVRSKLDVGPQNGNPTTESGRRGCSGKTFILKNIIIRIISIF